jgi:hypothetical protein
VEQRRGVIPKRVMARLCCVRALNACARVREQVRVWGSLERGGNPLEGGGDPRARRNPLEGLRAVVRAGTRSREVLALERGGTRSREVLALERDGTCSRGPLIGPLCWAAGATVAWAAPCVRV